ncbi:R3H domain-containing protein 2 [Elsinoe australis]|uniref:R3H domain-containing protein 2 n=1 Tax=Elsinoe australis TaxID=40998 RepID=A0A4U7B8V0_9PEZI|nr:R3H domain-containing protein 2 [Elsinoe australis]
MTKKHKAKGGHQQKHGKRKSGGRDKFSRESSGAPNHAFSMRDEVLNTERHHSEWTPSVRLRHQGMTFVSAGDMNPLDEAKIYEAEQKELEVGDQSMEGEIESDLEKSGGALAQMNIQSPPQAELSIEMDVESAELSSFQTPGQDTPSKDNSDTSAQGPPPDLFVVDSVGDKSLAPQGPAPVYRDVSPARDEHSEEEVVVFRGRTNRVVVRDDPPVQPKPSAAPVVSTKASAPQVIPEVSIPSVGKNPAELLPHPTDKVTTTTKDEPPQAPRVPAATNARAFGTNGKPESKATNKSRAGLKKQRRQPRKQKLDQEEDFPRAAYGMVMEDPDMMEDDVDEALLEDYIANMSEGEQILAALQQSASEWLSSVMNDDEEIEDEIEPTSASAPKNGTSKRRKNKRIDSSSAPATDVDMTDISGIPSNFEDDDDDDEDDEGTSDPGDDSELDSDLEYTAAERWEDESDLRQRQIDALTDEEIARILAKQEELGMGSDEILLLDDAGFEGGDLAEAEAGLEALLSRSGKPKRRGGGGGKNKQRSSFPSASLMADVLDADPYGGFDIMDFDRPSLRPAGKKGRKSAGPMPEELAALSDEELISDLQMAWANDRSKKAMKKAEREELRAEGLLGRGKANKFRPDPQVKFAEGMTLNQVRRELEDFLEDDDVQQKAFPPMEKKERKLLHEIANVFDLTSTSRGSGKNRFTLFSKRARTPDWDPNRWGRVERIAQRGFLKGAGKGRPGRGERPQRAGRGGGFSSSAVGYRNGEVVGASAPEIAESNFGRKLMEKMGWEKGMALGRGGEGMLLPVEARVKSGRGGLG